MRENKLVINKVHMLIEILSYLFLFVSVVLAIVSYSSGKEYPMQFDLQGNVTRMGNASELLMLPIIMIIVNGTTSLMLHFMPFKSWNMPFKVQPQNANLVYGMIAYMVVIMMSLFGLLTFFEVLFTSLGFGDKTWISALVFICLVFVDIIVFCVLAAKANKR